MTKKEQLKRDEGLSLKMYTDSLGHPTIGYGRALDTQGISQAEAETLLDNDIERVDKAVRSLLPWADVLDDARRGVLLNMLFQLGVGGVLAFHKMLRALEVHNYEEAARQMLDSMWHKQTPERCERLAAQMRTGVWS